MSKLLRWSLVALSLSVVALGAAGFVGLSWSHRADDICREGAPSGASGYSISWDWAELAYVCDYRAPGADTRRVGVTDAFRHPGPEPRH
jgi:hypothetical protein